MRYDESVKSLGNGFVTEWTPRKSSFDNITSFLQKVVLDSAASEKKKATEYKDQIDLYNSLRKAGYSAEEATSKVNKLQSDSGRGFLGRILGKQKDVFSAPTGEDPYQLERETKLADKSLKLAQGEKAMAEARKATRTVGKAVWSINSDGTLAKVGEVGEDDKVYKMEKTGASFSDLVKIATSDVVDRNLADAAAKQIAKTLGVTEEQAKNKDWLSQVMQAFKGGGSAQGKIKVKRKADGQTGTIDASEFNEDEYEKI